MTKRKADELSADLTNIAGEAPVSGSSPAGGAGKDATEPPLVFKLEATCGRARASTMRLPHGDVHAPVFMPVGNQGTVKGMSSEDMTALGCKVLLGNTFHIENTPSCELLEKCGGLHKLMHWPGNILTDSGGFQVVSLLKAVEIKEEGMEFEDPKKPGSRATLTPEKSIASQNAIGADIIMALDDVVASTSTDAGRIKEATERTLRWADRCLAAHKNPQRQNLFGIVQGHLDIDLREHSLKEMTRRNFPGYAIGGLSGGEAKDFFWRIVEQCTRPGSGLPADKPRYMMGVGYPLDIVVCVALGVDMFDCVYPCRTARFGTALVRRGQLRLTSSEYASDHRPLDPGAKGEAAGPLRGYTRAMLQSIVTKESVAFHMLQQHNLHFMFNLLSEMREAIKSSTFPDWVRSFLMDFFPTATPAPCSRCPPRWVRSAMQACHIDIDDLFDFKEGNEELPDMPHDGKEGKKKQGT